MPDTVFLDIAGKKTQVTIGGEGPPLLYLHSAGGETDWMPVAYTAAGKGFRWVAKGGKKIYVAFLVEYPTGQP